MTSLVKKFAKGLAFAISPTTYMLTKKAKAGKLKGTAKKLGKGFMAPIRVVQGKSPFPKSHKKHKKKKKHKN